MFCSLCNIYCSISENLFSVLKKILKINIYIFFSALFFYFKKDLDFFAFFTTGSDLSQLYSVKGQSHIHKSLYICVLRLFLMPFSATQSTVRVIGW